MDKQLVRRIHAYDFAILEMGLYLDTHPGDTCALQKRQELQAERAALVMEYEEKFGPYVVTDKDVRGDCWTWVNNPWPWECDWGVKHVAV